MFIKLKQIMPTFPASKFYLKSRYMSLECRKMIDEYSNFDYLTLTIIIWRMVDLPSRVNLNSSLFGSSRGNHLLLEHWWLGESNGDLMGGESVISVDDSVNLLLHGLSIEWVEEDSLVLSAVLGDSHWSSRDGGWENDIVQDFLMDSGKASWSWSHLTWMVFGYKVINDLLIWLIGCEGNSGSVFVKMRVSTQPMCI